MTDTGYLPAMLNPFEDGFFDNPYSRTSASTSILMTSIGNIRR